MTAKAEQQVQPFVLTAQHVQQYRDEGYTVFERIIPPPLLAHPLPACNVPFSYSRSRSPRPPPSRPATVEAKALPQRMKLV